MRQLLVRENRETRLVEDPPANVRRCEQLELGLPAVRGEGLRMLPEQVCEAEDGHRGDERQEEVPDRSVERPALELAVPP